MRTSVRRRRQNMTSKSLSLSDVSSIILPAGETRRVQLKKKV